MYAFGFSISLALLMLKAGPGQPYGDTGPMIVMGIGLYILMLGVWAAGYFIGNAQRQALKGAAVGLGLLTLLPGLSPFGFFWIPAWLAIALWIWLWCALGYSLGNETSNAVAGGVWGALLGPLGVLLAWWLYQPRK